MVDALQVAVLSIPPYTDLERGASRAWRLCIKRAAVALPLKAEVAPALHDQPRLPRCTKEVDGTRTTSIHSCSCLPP